MNFDFIFIFVNKLIFTNFNKNQTHDLLERNKKPLLL